MREGVPSVTALVVSFARAAAGLSAAPAPDPIASSLLPFGIGRVLKRLEAVARVAPVGLALRLGSLGLVDHLALRTAAIDDAVVEAVTGGVDQLVLLGAGLDARAYRLHALRDVTVYEVDHPATQPYKRARVQGLQPTAREVRFVTVDFECDALDERLAEAGHDASRPTVFVWEGVTMYLPGSATRASLRAMLARSSAGSQLVVTYALERWPAQLSGAVHASFGWLGEPLLGLTTTEAFCALLSDEGWATRDDSGPGDWARRYRFGSPHLPTVERVAVATCAP